MGDENDKPIEMAQCAECQAYYPEGQMIRLEIAQCLMCFMRGEDERVYQYED